MLDFVVYSPASLELFGLWIIREVMEVRLKKPECLEGASISSCSVEGRFSMEHTSKAPFTDSSHRSKINSSNAMDSLLTLIIKWHNCGKKNSISS
jgi:hypothetical protein